MRRRLWAASLLSLVVALALAGCAAEDPSVVDDSLSGSVFVITRNKKHEGYAHRAYGKRGDSVSEEERLLPEDVVEELTSVFFADDLELYIKGKTDGSLTYSLYDAHFEPLYEKSAEFSAPLYGGVYYLCVDVVWGDASRSEGYQYFFQFDR